MIKHWKRAGAALLATAILTISLTACNGNGTTPQSISSAENKSGTNTPKTDDEVVKLRIWGMANSTSPDQEQVAQAISELTREKIGVEVEIVRSGDNEKLNLALTSGEQLDLVNFHTYSGGLSTLVSTKYALPLDDLLTEHGKDILPLIPEAYMKCAKIGGITYMIPNLKDTARAAGFAMRKDILKEINVDPASIKTWDDVHDVLVKVKSARSDIYPLVPSWSGGGMQDVLSADDLGGSIGVLENVFTDSTTVVNLYESATYKEFCQRMYQWNKEGLIMPDSTTTTENNLMATIGFADYENNKPGKEGEISKAWGVDCALIELTAPHTYTSAAGGSSFFIPTVSKHPEKAMQLWNLMYTDAAISNLFINGIEGKHWIYTDDSKTTITTPEGVKTATNGYESLDWAWPNCRITPVWVGSSPDQWDQLQTFCDTAQVSPAMGFRFDNATVMNEITACNNVVDKYNVGLRWGELNPDEALPKFIDELKAAGADTIVAEKQTQLNAWLTATK